VREAVGPGVRVAASYDLHGNLSAGLVDPLDVLVAYRTNPHWDLAPTGFRAGRRLFAACRGEIAPVHAFRKLPMVLGGGTTIDFLAPMRGVFRAMRRLERRPKVVSASLFMVHPYTTAERVGWAVHVSTDGDRDLAERVADELAERAYAMRHEDIPPLRSATDAIAIARSSRLRRLGPVTFVDVDDIVGAGAPGGNTHLARAFVEVRASRAGSAPSIVDTLRLFADHASDDSERALVAHLASIASTVAPGAGARAPLEETPPRSGPHAPDPTSPSGITRARVQGAGFRAPPTQRTGTSSNPPPGADAAIKRSAPRGTLEPIPSPPPATVNPIKQSTRRVVMVPRDEDDSPISARTEEVVFARRPATPAPPGPAPAPAGAESPLGSEAPPVDDLLFALEELPAGDPRLAPPSTATEGSPVSVHDRPTAPPPAPEG